MKKTSCVAALVASFLLLGLTACAKPTDTPAKSNTNKDVDNAITEDITTSVTWDGKDASGSSLTYYINKNLYIKDGGHLTITDGAIVKFGPNGMFTVSTNGAITAAGAKFTSYKDPDGRKISAAPDANPAMGDWKQIDIRGGTGKFTSCKFYYGGKEECSTLAVSQSTGKGRVDQCEFRYCDGTHAATQNDVRGALRYTKDVTYNEDNNCVTNSVFKNNKWPLCIPAHFTLDGSNTFGLTDEDKNEYNFVHINSNSIKVETTWAKQTVPYLFAGSNRIAIQNGGILTIQGSQDEDDPTLVCFATDGFEIQTGGSLKLSNYITFSNRPGSETPFNGITCYINGKYMLLIPNTSGTIKIENYQPSSTYSNTDRQSEIQTTNTGTAKS